MGNIVLLDELTINKIAAGEVIERPASVVKEMVENSIDAGANIINIEIKNGGISYIRISDNGKGIKQDDLEISFERHATSKIRSAEDLENVKSMGFRGEALASISAISNVEMISKTEEQQIGNKIIVEAGNVKSIEEIGCPVGTTITVQNLFFNTPVRYKFLKKDYTESGYIEDIITRLALVNPNIAFKLINTGKTIIQTSGNGKIQDVIYAIYGKDIAAGVLEVDYKYEEIYIKGVIGKPEIARSNRANQIFFVNGRYVKDKTLSSSIENSFKGLLPVGKYAFSVLNIEIEPSKVDVNVHPAKLEVRFQEESKVFKAVYHAIKETVLKTELVENIKQEEPTIISKKRQNQQSNITDLFRKIVKNADKQETNINDITNNNMIMDIYNKRNNEKENIKPYSIQDTQTISIQKQSDYNTSNSKKMDVVKELLAMQQRLKQEAENSNIKTDIDEIIRQTNNIKEGTVNNEKIEIVQDTINIDTVQTNQILELEKKENYNNQNIKIRQENKIEQEIQKGEQELKAELNSQIFETQEKDIKEDNNINIDEKIEQETKLTDKQINEMIEKLDKMEEHNIEHNKEFVGMYEKIFGKLPASVEEKKKQEEQKMDAYELIKDNNISVFEEIEEYNKPVYKFIGIAFNTYIIIEIKKEMYIIDQHAAHERIMYEKVKKNYYSEEKKDSQILLLPDVITLTHKEIDILKDNIEMFEKAGFLLEEFGENTIKLTGVPDICIELDTKELFLETLDEINTVARTAKQEIEEKFIATVACKAAVKANMSLNKEEVEKLIEDLLELPNPFTCPHGRPTAIKMNQEDIEKKFARRK
ncbi:MAG: DNA mismatch repair endonuclease MutL [Clostridia bacterium]|jgi:DNA mismatch repair protein MutL|nr:DNA mismatch repair endonuclease MutL [Clostridia bacterium]